MACEMVVPSECASIGTRGRVTECVHRCVSVRWMRLETRSVMWKVSDCVSAVVSCRVACRTIDRFTPWRRLSPVASATLLNTCAAPAAAARERSAGRAHAASARARACNATPPVTASGISASAEPARPHRSTPQ